MIVFRLIELDKLEAEKEVFVFIPCKNICSNFEHKNITRPSVSVANSLLPPNLN